MDPTDPREARNNDLPKMSTLQSLEPVNVTSHGKGDFADIKFKNLKIGKLS